MSPGLDPDCRAFQVAIDVLARPWSGLILGLLATRALRFSELEERARGVGAKTLSARLKDLEARGLVARSVEPGPPVRVRYALTTRGRAFERVAEAIQSWGEQLVSEPGLVKASPPARAVSARGRRPRS